ncbi:adenylate/guanylate cyclase domain-containing protein [Acidovorax sp. SUPP3334]|uniref:adenylate/guanylate cyclase domain-containing protein n=1 Tax=Acidovorax sp. SUPP3334 TaxID=2920881 RepID=UPI0023DE6A52|nr:adenylate/guanylate cyclase domain-containing protein [Acidovorax sp. SUPP3334]GKT24038.1 PilZ domain-containing protein [Acidovorax sp. SUPP3334]
MSSFPPGDSPATTPHALTSASPSLPSAAGPHLQPREVTLLKIGLRDFSQMAAQLPPEQSLPWVERILACLHGVMARYGAELDHLTGDAGAVVFGLNGGGSPAEDDVHRAAMCALALQMAVRDLNDAFLQDRLPCIYLGIGIACGPALVGGFGRPAGVRQSPVLLGDVVIEAQQLRAFALRGQVLVSEAVYQRCWSMASVAPPVQVFVKGRSEPLSMRELVAVPSRKLKVPRQEFRRSHRVEARLPCTWQRVQDGMVMPHAEPCILRDMGYHGALLELSGAAPLLHGELRLSFDLPLVQYQARDVYARVVTLKPAGDQVLAGVEFTATSAEFDARVQRFVQGMVAG